MYKIRSLIWVFFLGLIFQTSFADTTVYQYRDAQGNVSFSDIPHNNAQEINVPNVQSFSPPPVINQNQRITSPPLVPSIGYSVTIISPTNEQTIWDNQGNILVQTEVNPAMSEGAVLQISVDDEPILTSKATTVQLQGIDQGTRIVSAQIINPEGKILATSPPVTVYLHHASLNAPLRKNQ